MNSETEKFFNKLQGQDRKRLALLNSKIYKNIQAGLLPDMLSMPLGIQLELTTSCNLHCKHCYNKSGEIQTRKDELGYKDWIDISQHIVNNGGVFQVIISGGEPLLLGDNLLKIMDVFHEDGSNFVLITNGYLLSESWVQKLKKYNFAWLQVSIDSVSSQRHDKFRGKQGSWNNAISGAIKVSQEGIPLKIACSLTTNEVPFVEELIEMSIKLGASSIILGDIMPSGRSFENENIILPADTKKELFRKINSLQTKYRESIIIENMYSMRTQLERASVGIIEGVVIRPNGDVRLDCIAPFVIGNVKSHKLKSIWTNTPPDVWQRTEVIKYIESVNYINGQQFPARG